MICPQCKTDNPASSVTCVKCSTPFPFSEQTLAGTLAGGTPPAPDSTSNSADVTFADATSAWSIAVAPSSVAAAVPGEQLVGTTLANRYEIISLLGEGGMGAVYKARDTELDRLVAIKLIRPELAKDPEMLRRFKQELILARQITHKNVIRIFDLGQSDGIKFITMELVEGRNLRSLLLERGKLPPEQAARIMLQICRALEAAHSEGVIHRDLKPQNIMLDASGRVTVMDFGIARSAYLPGMTQTGALIGTPEYMSPEQARGEKLTERSDLFSLGVILYELLIGTSPYQSDTPLATLWKRMNEKVTPPVTVDPTLPPALSDIVVKALEVEPENRFASTAEMAQQLEIWLGPSAGSSRIILGAPRMATFWKWAFAGLGVILGLGVIAFRVMNPSKPAATHAPLSVLVADFTNHTGDPIFDGTLEPMFNVALEGASFINASNRGDARRLADKLPNSTGKLDEQSARLVAVRQGVNVIVTGSLSNRGDNYRISVEAIDAVTGKTLASSDATAASKDEVLIDVPKLAAPIRKALGDTTPESVQLAATQGSFAASNLEAVHQYGIGMEQQFSGKMQDALQSFSKAAELDPNFARAYSGMAATSRNLGKRQDAEKYIKLAMQNVTRMTERERFRLRGTYYILTGDWQKCSEEYSALVKQYPVDNIGHGNLAYCYSNLLQMDKAVEEQSRAVELSPNSPAQHMNFSVYATYAGDFRTAEEQARDVLKLNPAYEKGYLALAYAQLGQNQLDQATETYGQLKKISKMGSSYASEGLADLAVYQGRFDEAARMLRDGAASDLAERFPDQASAKFAALANVETLRNHKTESLAAIKQALANGKGVKLQFLAARLYVTAGEDAKARELATALSSEIATEPQAYSKIVLGEIALRDKHPNEAIKAFTDASSMVDTWVGRFDLGRSYLDANLFVEADAEFDRCLKRQGEAMELFMSDVPTFSYVVPVYYYQGRVRQEMKSPGFEESYRTYLNIREKAGEDPLLADIHKRLKQ
jgi:tetratricopeptide (TPR) repeat protein